MLISSSLNKNESQYFPIDSSQELINEIIEVSNRMKTILYKGILETNKNKFTYQHYISESEIIDNEESQRSEE